MASGYDVIVIGGGPAGRAAAVIAARKGARVLLAERAALGGVCPLTGCVPKKILVRAADVLEHAQRAAQHAVKAENVALDWVELIRLKNESIREIPADTERFLEHEGITIVRGQGAFDSPDTVKIGGKYYRAARIVIATGSHPRRLAISGFDHTLDSTRFLELSELPESLVFIGAGPIGMEFSHVAARAGAKVSVLEAGKRPLMPFDGELVQQLVEHSRSKGIDIRSGVRISGIEAAAEGFRVVFSEDGSRKEIQAEQVINGSGRVANLDGLDLQKGGIDTNFNGIVVDRYLRSVSNKNVFVAGDVCPVSPLLSLIGTYEGKLAARNIMAAGPAEMLAADYGNIPYSAYTIPEISAVGLTEERAREIDPDVRVVFNDMAAWRMSRIYQEEAAFSKVIIDSQDRILGANLLGHRADDLINIFAMAMKFNISAAELYNFVTTFPSFSSDIKTMLR